MKVLFITRAYAPDAGGMERLSWELIHELSQHPQVAATIIALGTVKASRLKRFFRTSAFMLGSIPRALAAARRTDIIHLGDPSLAFLGWLIKLLHKKPVAVTIHGLDVTFPNPLYQLYLKLFFRNFDLYLPISTYASKLLKYQISNIKYRVITPGFHDTWYDPALTRQDLDKLLSNHQSLITNHPTILLTAGRLVKRKGHEWFIRDVLPHLPVQTVYVIAGEGPERQAIERAIAETNQYHRVALLGRVSHSDLKLLYNTVDAFIQPNMPVKNDAEGFGLVLLEAASCARPVFAADLEGLPAAIHDAKNGTLLPARDAKAWIAALQSFASPNPAARDYTLKTFAWRHQAQEYFKALSVLSS